jgi:hypothetical protein
MIVLALSTLAISNSVAAETFVTVSIASYHFDRSGDHCEVNPGIGIETDVAKDIRFHAGGYHNSNCRPSGYFCGSYTALTLGNWKAGSALCAFTGYHKEKRVDGKTEREDKELIAPLGVVSYERKTWGINILIVPPEKLLSIIGRKSDSQEEFKGLIAFVWKKPF